MATIVVYAGAILVTFLFVLMLAQPRGHASYDRVSWEAAAGGRHRRRARRHPVADDWQAESRSSRQRRSQQTLAAERAAAEHVAHLGAELFSRHLIAVEVAGTLLLVALVGATAIVGA